MSNDRETNIIPCGMCSHCEVCSYKGVYSDVTNAVVNTFNNTINSFNISRDGFLTLTNPKCKYFKRVQQETIKNRASVFSQNPDTPKNIMKKQQYTMESVPQNAQILTPEQLLGSSGTMIIN